MPRREASIEVETSPHELWRFLRDFEALCSCIPGVERVEVVSDRAAVLTVKEKVGVVPLVLALDASVEREDPPRGLHAVARCEHLTMVIDVALEPAGPKTVLHSTFDVTGSGPLKPIVDNLFERRATERTAEFSAALGRRFGADAIQAETRASETASAAAPSETAGRTPPLAPPAPQRTGWLDAIARWLRSRFARRAQ